ncbi:MAG: hypothetical protein ACREJC_07325, partial [Tepidisphaeraceae bacterium]
MSSAATSATFPDGSLPPPVVEMEVPPQVDRGSRSFAQQAFRDTFQQTGARLGACWVAILATLAVLAPLIANTHPVLMQTDRGWSSPMVRNLTAVDYTLLTAGACALAVMISPRARSR